MQRLGNGVNRSFTQLCIGPMSKNCVDAAIELAYQYDIQMVLIASRRQIECEELGGGYVNNWTTKSFADYVRSKDPARKIILARDHGGPWQHPYEVDHYTDSNDALLSAKLSFRRDIEAGFDILHLDPVFLDNFASPEEKQKAVLNTIFDLYEYCIGVSNALGKTVDFEIGTEEQSISPLSDFAFFENTIDRVLEFCDRKKFPAPLFFVVQTGTKILEMENIGEFPSAKEEIKEYFRKYRLADIVAFCEKRGIAIKEHNTDYLSNSALQTHPELGIHAANVAPEFGVVETEKLLSIMKELDLHEELSSFIKRCVDSNKWYKWVEDEQAITDVDKTKLCGHYLFADIQVTEIIDRVRAAYAKKGKDVDHELKDAVKKSILRYLINFNMI